MKVLVWGSRHFNDVELLRRTLDSISGVGTVIEGEARGADSLARDWALSRNIVVEKYPADWATHGKRAGPIRNSQMLKEGKPDLVVAFLGPESRGTANMIKQAGKAGVPVQVIEIGNDPKE